MQKIKYGLLLLILSFSIIIGLGGELWLLHHQAEMIRQKELVSEFETCVSNGSAADLRRFLQKNDFKWRWLKKRKDKKEISLLYLCLNEPEKLSLLLQYGARDVNDEMILGANNPESLALLLKYYRGRVDKIVSHNREMGLTCWPLGAVFAYNSVLDRGNEMALLLLAAGADINRGLRTKNNGDFSPLALAARDGNTDGVRLLLSCGADVNLLAEEKPLPEYLRQMAQGCSKEADRNNILCCAELIEQSMRPAVEVTERPVRRVAIPNKSIFITE